MHHEGLLVQPSGQRYATRSLTQPPEHHSGCLLGRLLSQQPVVGHPSPASACCGRIRSVRTFRGWHLSGLELRKISSGQCEGTACRKAPSPKWDLNIGLLRTQNKIREWLLRSVSGIPRTDGPQGCELNVQLRDAPILGGSHGSSKDSFG